MLYKLLCRKRNNRKDCVINSENRLVDDLNVPEPTPNGIRKMVAIIRRRIRTQGWVVTLRWLYVILMSKLFGYVPISYSRITPDLFVGSQYKFLGKLRLRLAGITATINLREEYDYAERSIVFDKYLHLPVPDETPVTIPQLEKGITFIDEMLKQGEKVYVHCASGVGRSVMLVTAYFIQQGLSFNEAHAKIKKVRPFIYLFPSQKNRLKEFEVYLQQN